MMNMEILLKMNFQIYHFMKEYIKCLKGNLIIILRYQKFKIKLKAHILIVIEEYVF